MAAGGGTLTLERVQKELVGPGRRMLFYVIGLEGSFVFDIPHFGEAATVHRLEVTAEAGRILGIESGPQSAQRLGLALAANGSGESEELLVQLSSPPPRGRRRPALERALHGLFQTLVPASLWAALRRCPEVIVVPDGLLHQVPFEVLVPEPGSPQAPSRYWIEEGPVTATPPPATALSRLALSAGGREDASPAPFRIVSVSDPDFGPAAQRDGRTLERLPGTARESAVIQEAFAGSGGKAEVLVLQGKDAREERVRAALPGARYIHLATHGLVDETHDGLFATLALTPPPRPQDATDDGQLQLYEIYGLALRAELAVLSSCESRVGNVVAGEGVFALSRGFLAAGTRRVVASLWPAEDDSTAEIVGGFFRAAADAEAQGHRPDFTAALAQAKRAVRARSAWGDPFFWGPFVLEGVP